MPVIKPVTILTSIIVYIILSLAPNAQSQESLRTYQAPSGDPEQLFVHPLGLFYTADDGVHGKELWLLPSLDSIPAMVRDITIGPTDSNLTSFMKFNDRVVIRNDVPGIPEIWISDGTKTGTKQIKLPAGPISTSYHYPISSWNEGFLFAAQEDSSRTTLWSFDSDTLRPRSIAPLREGIDQPNLQLVSHALHPEYLLFSATKNISFSGLWKSDGTQEGTTELLSMYESPSNFIKIADKTMFNGRTEEDGWELWISDGTTEGTVMIKDIQPGKQSSSPGEFVVVNTNPPRVYFAAETVEFGRELWRSDGTAQGTWMVQDIDPGSGNGEPYKLHFDGTRNLYFIAKGEGKGNELWRTNIDDDSTILLKDIYPGPTGSDPYAFSPIFYGNMYFSANDPQHGEELWRTNGEPQDTVLVKDIYPGPQSSFPYYTTEFQGYIVFAAEHPLYGRELWRTGGTEISTVLVQDLLQDGLQNPSSSPQEITATPKLLFFAADDLKHGMELWCTDGTEDGTRMVRDIFQGRASSDPQELTAVGDLVYFRADDLTNGVELWVSDGTDRGTKLVYDIEINGGSAPRELTLFGEKIVFVAYNSQRGDELWIADRHSANALGDIRTGPQGSNPRGLAVWGDRVYFRADDGIHGEELWSTDGTADGTVMVTDIISVPIEQAHREAPVPFNNGLFFAHNTFQTGSELWRINETGGQPTLVKNIAR